MWVIGIMISLMGMAITFLSMVKDIVEISWMDKRKEKENIFIWMETLMMESGLTIKNRE